MVPQADAAEHRLIYKGESMELSTIRKMLDTLSSKESPESQEEYNDMMLTVQMSLLMAAVAIIERLDKLLEKEQR